MDPGVFRWTAVETREQSKPDIPLVVREAFLALADSPENHAALVTETPRVPLVGTPVLTASPSSSPTRDGSATPRLRMSRSPSFRNKAAELSAALVPRALRLLGHTEVEVKAILRSARPGRFETTLKGLAGEGGDEDEKEWETGGPEKGGGGGGGGDGGSGVSLGVPLRRELNSSWSNLVEERDKAIREEAEEERKSGFLSLDPRHWEDLPDAPLSIHEFAALVPQPTAPSLTNEGILSAFRVFASGSQQDAGIIRKRELKNHVTSRLSSLFSHQEIEDMLSEFVTPGSDAFDYVAFVQSLSLDHP